MTREERNEIIDDIIRMLQEIEQMPDVGDQNISSGSSASNE